MERKAKHKNNFLNVVIWVISKTAGLIYDGIFTGRKQTL